MKHQLTAEQKLVCNKVATGKNLFIQAFAGAAKTTTAKEYCANLPGHETLYSTFNTANITAASEAGVNAICQGLHSVGYRALRKHLGRSVTATVHQDKSLSIYKQLKLQGGALDFQLSFDMFRQLNQNSEYGWSLVESRLGKGVDPSIQFATKEIIALNSQKFFEDGIVDFPDMLYLSANSIPGKFLRYKHLVIDEVFDLAPSSLAMLRHGLKTQDTQLIFCGDYNQSIYECFGASGDLVLAKVAKWEQANLTTSFRCPEAVAEVAREFVPAFNAFRSGGTVTDYDEETTAFAPNSLVIATKYEALIGPFMSAVKAGKRVALRGVNIIKPVLDAVSRITTPDFNRALTMYSEITLARIDTLPRTVSGIDLAKLLSMRVSVALGLVGCFESLEQARAVIKSAKNVKESTADIIFSSVHRSKGFENNNVYFLDYDKTMNEYLHADAPGTKESYRKVLYVGVTRAKENLILG